VRASSKSIILPSSLSMRLAVEGIDGWPALHEDEDDALAFGRGAASFAGADCWRRRGRPGEPANAR
jgi:hypothetical protein